MKKLISLLAAFLLAVGMLPAAVFAAEEPSFYFELTADGEETKQVRTGDVITVILRLKRKDASHPYTMYAMQDEIRYDGDFFRLVEGSAVPGRDITVTDIGMRDSFREFYMNYLSGSGGASWEADTLVGSFRLEVIATSGTSKITSQDYLVSDKKGSDSLDCTANELTVILTTECRVRFESKGGSRVGDQLIQYGEKIEKPEDPTREGYVFDGWYRDLDETERWDFENDAVAGNQTLFAGWKESDSGSREEAPADDDAALDPMGEVGLAPVLLVSVGLALALAAVIFLLQWAKHRRRSR